MDRPARPPEFAALDLDVDAVIDDEDGHVWAFEALWDEDVTVTWSTPFVDGWVLSADWKLVDDVVQLEQLRVRRAGGDEHATARMVAKLRLGRVYYTVRRLFRAPWLGFVVPDAWLEAIERDGLGVPKPGPPPGEHLALLLKWAARYDDARKRDPRRPVKLLVQEYPGETAAAIRARLTRARDEGLLTKTDDGKAGGHLTAKARKLLKEGT
jgi:hypothetical protein